MIRENMLYDQITSQSTTHICWINNKVPICFEAKRCDLGLCLVKKKDGELASGVKLRTKSADDDGNTK